MPSGFGLESWPPNQRRWVTAAMWLPAIALIAAMAVGAAKMIGWRETLAIAVSMSIMLAFTVRGRVTSAGAVNRRPFWTFHAPVAIGAWIAGAFALWCVWPSGQPGFLHALSMGPGIFPPLMIAFFHGWLGDYLAADAERWRRTGR